MLALPEKSVTEADVRATEARLAASFQGLKSALSRLPSDAARPVTDTVRAHPFAAMATAAGAGFVAYRLLDVLMPRTKVIMHEAAVKPGTEVKEKPRKKRSLAARIISEAIALATPYITAYVQNEVARLLAKPGKEQTGESQSAVPEPDTD